MDYAPGLVSILMGCYDAEPEHLTEALDSALNQTYRQIEVVVVDDGSTKPETLATLDRYRHRVLVLHQDNAGVAAARNTAAAHARGEFLLLLDSDDRLGPTIAEQGVAVLRDEAVELAYSAATVFGGESWEHDPPTEYRLADLMQSNRLTICSMIRHTRWDEIGGQTSHLRDGYEDYEFWIRVLRDGGIARRTPTARFEYRVRGGSRSKVITDGAMARTREVIVAQNPEHLEQLLWAAFGHMDDLDKEKRDYLASLHKWHELGRPLVWLRNMLRRIGR